MHKKKHTITSSVCLFFEFQKKPYSFRVLCYVVKTYAQILIQVIPILNAQLDRRRCKVRDYEVNMSESEEELIAFTNLFVYKYFVIGTPNWSSTLVLRRALNLQVRGKKHEQQENIFRTRCLINSKVYSMIINGGSCATVASTMLVERLGLTYPYRLQWLNEYDEVKVSKQVMLPFSIDKYKDKVYCDVVPMHTSHVILRRP